LQITIKFGEPLRRAIGQRRISLTMPEDATANDLLRLLSQRYPDFESAFRGDDSGQTIPYIFFLNNRPVTAPNYTATYLQDGDVVRLVAPVVGGCHG
jgi:molybdopterin converting factor small subunit